MNKKEVVETILRGQSRVANNKPGVYFAPANIALCKYWGKRDLELNLPQTSSLSVSLGHLGAKTAIQEITDSAEIIDEIWINGEPEKPGTPFSKNLKNFLDLFKVTPTQAYQIKTETNIPIGAGLASSAAGFAAVVGALNDLYGWQLPLAALSILGRLGSGSASRSFWSGFVEWQMGVREDGMDSKGHALPEQWPALRVGILILNTAPKPVSSRVAMERTVLTSPFYSVWPVKQAADLRAIKAAIAAENFEILGSVAETNALAMHSLMLTATPPILYSEAATIESMHRIWKYREEGLALYFTQDAGPNLKLLFLEKDRETVSQLFPTLEIIQPFGEHNNQ